MPIGAHVRGTGIRKGGGPTLAKASTTLSSLALATSRSSSANLRRACKIASSPIVGPPFPVQTFVTVRKQSWPSADALPAPPALAILAKMGERQCQLAASAEPTSASRRSFWEATCSDGPPTRRRPSPCSTASRSRARRDRHRRRLFGLGSRQSGGESETIIGEWMKARGNRARRHPHHQGRLADGQGQGGPVAGLYRAGGRSVAEAASDRRHRPLPLALARHGDALRRHARRLSAPDREGQDPLVRRFQPHRRRFSSRRSRRPRRAAVRATRSCSRNTISPTAPRSSTASRTFAGARKSASSPISAWRRAFCRASTAPRRTLRKARGAAA